LTTKERVLASLRGEKHDRIPASSVTQVGVVAAMEKIGVFWPDAHYDAEKMAKLGMSLYKLVGLEAARIPFCLTVQAEAFGCEIELGSKDTQPSVRKPAFSSIEQLSMPSDYLQRKRIPVVLKATSIMKKNAPDLPIIVGIEGAYTLAGHLMGIENLMKWSIKQRDNITKAVDLATKASIEYSKAAIDAGAEVICILDPTSSPDLMSPKDFASLVKPKLKEVSDAIRAKGAASVLHICGNAQKILKDMAESGFDGLSIEEKINLTAARQLLGPRPALVGNVSAAKTMFSGTPQAVREEAKKAIEAGADILAPGCGIAPSTPLENIRALVEATMK
jgi:[methyl-Co(III) methanol-specific corrinoid protein]:coenzyme M methyltransferase